MRLIEGYEHQIASHCETGSARNLLRHAGLDVSEPLVFGLGSGTAFYYLFFVKGPTTFPLIALRNRPGSIFAQLGELTGIDFRMQQFRSTAAVRARADDLIDCGTPVAAAVDMFRMKYLPQFMRVHAPFHFVALVGRGEGRYAMSDPYFRTVAELDAADLEAAWETHAPMAQDNLLVYVRALPSQIDWRRAARKAMKKTCDMMVLPPGIGRVLSFVGVEGMRTFARKMRFWPRRYRGVRLREGVLFHAVGFEDQGTGGGAFRLMYGAFLQEAAELFDSMELRGLASRLLAHGRDWRKVSRQIVVLGRMIPMDDDAYEDWYAAHRQEVQEQLDELSSRFLAFADVEQELFTDLRRIVGGLPR